MDLTNANEWHFLGGTLFSTAFGSSLYEKGAEGSKAALLLHIQDKEEKEEQNYENNKKCHI